MQPPPPSPFPAQNQPQLPLSSSLPPSPPPPPFQAQAAARAAPGGGGAAPSPATAPALPGGRAGPPPPFKGARDERKKKEKPVEVRKREGGDEWETVGSTKSKGKPALKVAVKGGGGWGKAAAPQSAPAAGGGGFKNKFDFGDEDGSEEEDEDEGGEEEVEEAGSKSTGSAASGSNGQFVGGSGAASPHDSLADAFDEQYKKKARGLLDELFMGHILEEALELLQEMVLPLDMSRHFTHLCVSHCVAR